MNTKFLIGVFAFLMALGFTACDDSSSADDNSGMQTPTQPNGGNGGNGNGGNDNTLPGNVCGAKPEAGCTFKKEDNVWKFAYDGGRIVEIYTWVDDTTVEYKWCMNVTHMDRDDSTHTNLDRDSYFKEISERCELYTAD